jgi:ketosteroid isomerase-like protein
VASRPITETRSKEHHVAVGLGFLSAFKSGDVDACADMLHPDVEWYTSPKLLDTEMVRGRNDVRTYIQALYDRFSDGLELAPEDGRQVGDHVLLVTLIKGRNHFTGQPVKSRECWVISVRDDMWGRVVAYPNAPAARLGFEQLQRAVPPVPSDGPEPPSPATDPSYAPGEAAPGWPLETAGGDTLPPAMAEAAPTPAEFANADSPVATVAAAPAARSGDSITLTFTLEEADALNRWLLKPAQDGGLAGDDAAVRPGLLKIRSAVEHAQAISEVRHELEQAGIPTQHLSDQQVAQLSRRISQAAPRLGGPAPQS